MWLPLALLAAALATTVIGSKLFYSRRWERRFFRLAIGLVAAALVSALFLWAPGR